MAAPTITAISGVPATPVAPGVTVPLVVEVTDADTRDVTVTFTVTDSLGGVSAPTSVVVEVVDNVTATGETDSGTLTQTGPLTFDFVG